MSLSLGLKNNNEFENSCGIFGKEMTNKQGVDHVLQDNLYMTIAVSDRGGFPWIANLYYAFDKNYNFYWYSSKDTVHSKMVRENPNIALSVFDSTAVGDGVDAVYVKAKAFEIDSGSQLLKGLRLYAAKMVKTKFANKTQAMKFIKGVKDFEGLSKLRMYKAVPEKIYRLAPSTMYNEKFIDSRIEIKF